MTEGVRRIRAISAFEARTWIGQHRDIHFIGTFGVPLTEDAAQLRRVRAPTRSGLLAHRFTASWYVLGANHAIWLCIFSAISTLAPHAGSMKSDRLSSENSSLDVNALLFEVQGLMIVTPGPCPRTGFIALIADTISDTHFAHGESFRPGGD
jgi:hypothetical protein